MDGKQASNALGITYRRLNYMLKKVDGLVPVKYGESEGKARDIGPHDLTKLWLAFALKADDYTYAEIQKAIDTLNDNWSGASPEEAGVLLALGVSGDFRWALNTNLVYGDGKDTTPIDYFPSLPKIFYNIRKVAYGFYANSY